MIEWVHGGDWMTVGKNIKTIRKKKGITQKKLSEMTGIAEITIRKYEADAFVPKKSQIEKIASVLQVTPFQIMGITYWDETADLTKLQKEANFFDQMISSYGEEIASTFNDFLSLTDEGQRKVSEYIDDLIQIPKYKK